MPTGLIRAVTCVDADKPERASADRGLGRSRGGLTSKIHLFARRRQDHRGLDRLRRARTRGPDRGRQSARLVARPQLARLPWMLVPGPRQDAPGSWLPVTAEG